MRETRRRGHTVRLRVCVRSRARAGNFPLGVSMGTWFSARFALCESFKVLSNDNDNNNHYNHIVISSAAYFMTAILIRCLIKFAERAT